MPPSRDHASDGVRSVVRQLEKGKGAFATSLLDKSQQNDSISSLDGISDSEAGTSDGDTAHAEAGISAYLEEESGPSAKRAKSDTSDRPKAAAVRV